MNRVAACLFLSVFAGSAVAAEEKPSPLAAAATAMVDALAKGDYAAAGKDFDAVMQKALPADKREATWKAVLEQVGPFQKRTGVRVEKSGKYDVVFVTCRFEKMPLDVKVVFSADKQITGLFFLPAKGAFDFQPPPYARPELYREVPVTVGAGEWPLPGTLTLPRGDGPFPAVVLLHGSGPQDRDETIGPNKPLRDLAWGLASQGIAVLRYEKRTREHGARLAAGKESLTVKEEVVDDAVAAAALLRKHREVDGKRVFVLGHSLGALMAPEVGARDPSLAGLVLMAGNSRPLEDVVLEQFTYLFSLKKEPSEKDRERLEKVKKQVARLKDPKLAADTPAADLPLGAPAAYWLALRAYDARATAARLKQPMLILQGERDYQVTMDDFEGWKKALASRPAPQPPVHGRRGQGAAGGVRQGRPRFPRGGGRHRRLDQEEELTTETQRAQRQHREKAEEQAGKKVDQGRPSGFGLDPVSLSFLCVVSVLSVSLWLIFSPSAADGVHGARRLDEARRVDLVPLPLVAHVPADRLRQGRVVRPAAQEGLDVGLGQREQAVAQLALAGQPQAVAAGAERPRHRGDDADPAAAVGVAEVHGRRPRVVVLGRHQRADLALDLLEDLVGEIDLAPLPDLGADRHVLDEAHLQAVGAGVARQGHHVGVGQAADRDGVDLEGAEAGPPRRLDARQNLPQPVAPRHLAEALRVERVQADVDAPQAGVVQRLRLPGQQQAVGRQADVLDAGDLGQQGHQPRQVAAHERLATGQANLVDPERRGNADESRDLLKGEKFGAIHERHFLGHAIRAAQVATVRHADAQVVVHAAEGVDQLVGHYVAPAIRLDGPTPCCRQPSFPFSRWAQSP
jgi:uncharacterized protein